ncbi:ARM repeat-containing protein [Xylaria arbuscula]|nr:ARM repeat-containing protein [Xylaria arbuscula]
MAPSQKDDAQNPDYISGTDWSSHNIWSRGYGAITSSARDTTDSRASDEVSPTAPSGSLITPISERPAAWPPGPWQNGTTSSSTRNNLPYNYNDVNNVPNSFAARQPIGQRPSISSQNPIPPGPVESPTIRFKSAVRTPLPSEERAHDLYAGSGPYPTLDSTGLGRRKSADPSSRNMPYNRAGTLGGRQHEFPGQFGDSNTHSLSNVLPTNSEHRRPSYPRPSLTSTSLAAEPPRSQVSNFTNEVPPIELNDAMGNLGMADPTEPPSRFSRNGDYQFLSNHTTPAWQHDMNGSATNPELRLYQNGLNEDTTWKSPYPGLRNRATPEVRMDSPYSDRKQSSVERNSPASQSHRPNVNSPRHLSGNPVSRTNGSWNPQVFRSAQDIDRLHGLAYQQPNYHPYFDYVPQFSTPVDPYAQQIPSYRQAGPANGYGLPINYPATFALQPSRNKDPAQNARSPVLEDYRTTHKTMSKRWELKDIYGYIVEFSGDQHGSRFIQDKLSSVSSDEKEQVFKEVEPNALQLMKDVFGNYVIQKLFEHGTQKQKKMLAELMLKRIADLSVQMYSCRVVQKALEHVLDDQQRAIIEELRPDVVRVAKDQNGNHVIQKIIEQFPKQCVPFVMEAFQGQVPQLATHNYACRVIQRILEHGTRDEKERLMVDIHACTPKLLTDQYGNYVIQHVIIHGQPKDRRIMISQVIDKAWQLSRHKFASNVVEKCIEHGTPEERSAIHAKLTSNDGSNSLQAVMKDQFGNYVIQMMIKHLDGPEKLAFAQEVNSHIPQLKKQNVARTNTGLEKLYVLVEQVISTKPDSNASSAATGTSPSTPAVLTPPLTEQNSPQSSSPPSTNMSSTDEGGEGSKTTTVPR